MAGEAPEMPWQKARRLKRADHKAERREGSEIVNEDNGT
jgi:hypothetical protein